MANSSRFSKSTNGASLAERIGCRNALLSVEDNAAVEVYSLAGTRPEPYTSSLYESATDTARRVSGILKYGL